MISVNVPDPIYGKVDLEEGLDFHVQLRTCWATPTDDAADAQKYSVGFTTTDC